MASSASRAAQVFADNIESVRGGPIHHRFRVFRGGAIELSRHSAGNSLATLTGNELRMCRKTILRLAPELDGDLLSIWVPSSPP